MVQLVRVFSLLPLILVTKVRREERRLVQSHLDHGALSRDQVASVENDSRVSRWVRQRLVRNGVLKLTPAGSYFDETAYAAFRWRRRRRVLVMATLLLLGFGIALFRGDVSL
jgi:hypothetical protein